MSGPISNDPPAVQVRRRPVQERSTDTVNHILSSASALLTKVPLEEITTSRIAAEAGISIGGLYRFFPDKQTILDAIAVRHMDDFRASLVGAVAKSVLSDGPGFLNRVIDAYIAYLDAHPDFRTLALGRHISAVTRQVQAGPDAGPASLVKWFIMWRLGVREPALLDLKLRIAIEAGERLIGYAYEQPAQEERAAVLTELKALLAAYLF
ncbi:TetR family transcriptional regulator [Paludibaculum fermentans]|uniref:TetR family transcriptional regulator n=1 Tax=Paludibaculum fermentans TaxID=1473598 RepID=UPI003EB91AC4